MNTFFDRLREERERLGLSQADFGAIGGVKKLAQINYEKGDRHPDSAYLSAIAAAGSDVLYILTGQRGQMAPQAAALNDRTRLKSAIEAVEEGLSETKRRLPPAKKAELVLAAYDLLAEPTASRGNVVQLVRLAA